MDKNILDFQKIFDKKPKYKIIVPSRANLIGEHSDYFDMLVLPMAIENVAMISYIKPRRDRKIRIYTKNLPKEEKPMYELTTMDDRKKDQWIQYVQGAIAMYAEEFTRKALKGFDILIDSSIPIGAGLSSSTALTMTSLAALGVSNKFPNGVKPYTVRRGINLINKKGESETSHKMMSKLCMMGCWAEYWYGTRGGAMDHFATTVSRKGYATLLDNKDFTYDYVPVPGEITIVVCDTGVRHNQLFSEFDNRKKDAFRGFKKMRQIYPKLKSVRQISFDRLKENKDKLTDIEYRRLRHPITERIRLKKFVKALKNKDFEIAGKMLNETMKSLRDDYEVSCYELDLMHKIANKQKGCYGSRVSGGGFGGAVEALVRNENVDEFISNVKTEYDTNPKIQKNKILSKLWIAESGDGLHIEKI